MGDVYTSIIILIIIIYIALALIPATIAKDKGYNFSTFYLYGLILFPISLIHLAFLPNKYEKEKREKMYYNIEKIANYTDLSLKEDINIYKCLMKKGIISLEEFEAKRKGIIHEYYPDEKNT